MNHLKLPKLYSNSNSNNVNYNLKNIIDLVENRNEEAIIIEAIKVGYLVYPSKDLIWKAFKKQTDYDERIQMINSKRKMSRLVATEQSFINDFSIIEFLNLSNVPLIEVGEITLCKNLKILNLSNNHLITIEPLSVCVHLFRLDLQNNQISQLPEKEFWSYFNKLTILYLHNNPIGKLEYLKYIAGCPSLEILTLYDSPVSLKYNYRHHAVNSIVTLKALDDYVISDEEIIEEAKFANMFSAKSPQFRINLQITPSENNCYKSELKSSFKLLKKVNKVLSHFSPVLILQRFTRGFIARNRYHLMKNKFFEPKSKRAQKWWKESLLDRETESELDKVQTDKTNHTSQASTHLSVSETSNKDDTKKKILETDRNNTPSSFNNKRNILIDLSKLENRESLIFEDSKGRPFEDHASLKLSLGSLKKTEKSVKRSEKDEKILNLFREQQIDPAKLATFSHIMSMIEENPEKFMRDDKRKQNEIGSYTQRYSKKLTDNYYEDEDDERFFADFRLRISATNNSILKPKEKFIVDLLKEKFAGFNSVKQMEIEAHRIMSEMKQQEKNKIIIKNDLITNDQRFFQKIYGNMGFGSLRAVDKAYEDRNVTDQLANRQKKIEYLRELNKASLQRVGYYKEDRIKEAKILAAQDCNQIAELRNKNEKELEEFKEKTQLEKLKRADLSSKRKKDINWAIQFSKQHLSVSKALQKHEFSTLKDSKSKETNEFVSKLKYDKHHQHEIVKNYLEKRNLLRVIQSRNERDIIESRVREDVEYDANMAKMRVEYLKALKFDLRDTFLDARKQSANQMKILNLIETFEANIQEKKNPLNQQNEINNVFETKKLENVKI